MNGAAMEQLGYGDVVAAIALTAILVALVLLAA